MRRSSLISLLFSVVFVVLLIGISMLALSRRTPSLAVGPSSGNQNAQGSSSGSSLQLGTNLGLFDASDPILTSAPNRALLQQMHLQLIRIPMRSGLSPTIITTALQTVHDMGMSPIIILSIRNHSDIVAYNTPFIQAAKRIFPQQIIYYEFGNEPDLSGISSAQYIAAWNASMPGLKAIAAPNGHFVGPVLSRLDDSKTQTYLQTFLQNAKPLPDEISWHMYACDTSGKYVHPKDTASSCLAHLNNWDGYFKYAQDTMQSTINTQLPIMITEFNYDPISPQINNDTAFLQSWTKQALQIFMKNHVFAAIQYQATGLTPLVQNGQLTDQGGAVQTFSSGSTAALPQTLLPVPTCTPTPISNQTGSGMPASSSNSITKPSCTPTPTSPGASSPSLSGATTNTGTGFSFEDGGMDGWYSTGHVSNMANSNAQAEDGQRALQVTVVSQGPNDDPYVAVASKDMPSPQAQAGQTITAYVYASSDASAMTASPFVMDSQYAWYAGAAISLTQGTWTKLTFTIPTTIHGAVSHIGIQFSGSGTVSVDNVSWQ